jgi:hypothetical protein
MVQKKKQRRDEGHAADLGNNNAILRQTNFAIDLVEKNYDESFQDFDFWDFAICEISNFANLIFAFAAIGPPVPQEQRRNSPAEMFVFINDLVCPAYEKLVRSPAN